MYEDRTQNSGCVYQRIFNQLIQILHRLVDTSQNWIHVMPWWATSLCMWTWHLWKLKIDC